MSERNILIGCTAIFAVGNLVGSLAPQILFGAMHRFGVSAAQAGLLILAEGVTLGLCMMAFGHRPPPLTHRRLATAGMTLFVALNIASYWMPGYAPLLALRALAGLADAMLAFTAVSLIALTIPNTDTGYATATAATVVYGAAIVGIPPLFLDQVQGLAYLPFCALVSLLLAPLLLLLPRDTRPGVDQAQAHAAQSRLAQAADAPAPPRTIRKKSGLVMAALVAILIPQCFQSFALFSFSPAIGARIGLGEQTVNGMLSIATLACLLGPLLAGLLSAKTGRWWPLFGIALLFLAANTLFLHTVDARLFALCLAINLVCCYFTLPVLLAWSADLDATGRYGSIIMGTLASVNSLSPFVVGALVDQAGLAILPRVVAGSGALLIGALLCLRWLDRSITRAMPEPFDAGAPASSVVSGGWQ